MTRTQGIFAIVLFLAAAAWAIEHLIVTDREAIETLLAGAHGSVEREDWDGLAAAIAPDYAERGMDREKAVGWIRDLWRRSHMKSADLTVDDVRVDGDRAAARVTIRPGLGLGGWRFGGRVDVERRPEGWRITGMAPDDSTYLPR